MATTTNSVCNKNKKQSPSSQAFQFIRGLGSSRASTRKFAEPQQGGGGGALGRWLRELRPKPEPMLAPPLNRANPIYHSEGRGQRKRNKQKDNRRHSFNEQMRQRCQSNGVDIITQCPSAAKNVSLVHTMMSTRSTPNLKQPASPRHTAAADIHYNYLPTSGSGGGSCNSDSPPPTPPVRDASSLKGIKYGPGHEKFPSWPVPAAADQPQLLRTPPSGGSHRSKSWTDHTNYPKEKVVQYTRPYMKRQQSAVYTKQLKTVMERCEKLPVDTFEARLEKMNNERLYFPRVDREGKALGDLDYMVPSPPERDTAKPQLTQADLEEYARSYQDPQDILSKPHLTQAGLEEYTRSYEEAIQHQKQPSYAQSEGYHSYVSSTDSTATPFLDRLRRDSEATRSPQVWEDSLEIRGRDSVVTTSSGSVSSSETLKWHGSMSDVSVASSSHLANSSTSSSRQLIAHSARVQTPQRHHSESVLYMGGQPEVWQDKENRNNHHNNNQLKLFPVNTYTVEPDTMIASHRSSMCSSTSLSVADRINELERQQTKYTYLDPEKKHRVSDPTLKAIQKKALLSYYERHTSKSSWRSEPQLAQSAVPQAPLLPPRPQPQTPSRRASCASDYASSIRGKTSQKQPDTILKIGPKHAHSNSCGSLSADLLGPVIMGPAISIDDWVPERPPKNPHLRTAYPDLFHESRVPSPELPPPSPPTVLEDEVLDNDEPLPPPPTEMETEDLARELSHSPSKRNSEEVHCQLNGLPDPTLRLQSSVRMSQRRPTVLLPPPPPPPTDPVAMQPNPFVRTSGHHHRQSYIDTKRHSQKFVGTIAISQKVINGLSEAYHSEALRVYKPPPPPAGETQVKAIPQAQHGFRQRCSTADEHLMPPPLYPRQGRVNQSMRARIPDASRHVAALTRNSPPRDEKEGSRYNMSQSKASYLAARREREHGPLTTDIGSYKRTMSPSGETPLRLETTTDVDRSHWTVQRPKDCDKPMRNNNNLVRRSSLVETKCNSKKQLLLSEDTKSPLPDVLPINVKVVSRKERLTLTETSPVSGRSSAIRKSPESSPKLATAQFSYPLPSKRNIDRDSPPRKTPLSSPRSPNSPHFACSPATKLSSLTYDCPVVITQYSSCSISPDTPPRTSKLPSPQFSTALRHLEASSLTPASLSIAKCSPPSSPVNATFDEPKVIEGLQLIQRTEVTLRVNTCTSDASSQTEQEEVTYSTPLPARRKLQEEIECERLSQDLASQLSPSDRLKCILVPGPEYKKPTDYVSGLFKVEVTSRPRPHSSPFRSRNSTPTSSPPPSHIVSTSILTTNTTSQTDTIAMMKTTVPVFDGPTPLSANSTYFTTSESKAKFLTRYSRDMSQYNIVKDTKDLNQKKEELVNRLDKKLEVLRSEQLVVSEECRMNDELGEHVERHVARVARPHEAAKFRLHVEEVGKITSLLLGLSGRLARVENALMGLSGDHSEKKILESKRDKLQEQLEEAKKLKESIDKRSVSVSNILYKYLSSEEYTDYDHFINMKAKLIMDSREIADKIKLGEEQLAALKETLAVTD